MSPQEPIESLALADILTSLRLIQTPAYNFDIKPSSVTEELQEILLVPPTEVPFLLCVLPDIGGPRRWVQRPDEILDGIPFAIIGRVDVVNLGDPSARRIAGQRLYADIEVALIGGIPARCGRGGLVRDTVLDRPNIRYGLGNDPVVTVEVRGTLQLHRTYGSPSGE